jgi:adenine-specific DNA-methyltransferase
MNRLFSQMLNGVTCGDCIDVMAHMPARSVDFVLTDPPYLVRYRDRSGRRVINDDNDAWLRPAFREIRRLLKPEAFAVSFYGWHKIDAFMDAWKSAGFQPVGHIVFRKKYASSSRYLEYRHEQAYLLAKGRPPVPVCPPPDVIDWTYTENRLHPTQKPLTVLRPLIDAFSRPGDTVLDPFCGSGSTLVAARERGRHAIGIELDPVHHRTAARRLRP